MAIPKFNYKIFNKRYGRYMSSSKKSTWQVGGAVTNYLKELVRNKEDLNDFEVHIFPVAEHITKTAQDFIDEGKAKRELAAKKKN